MNYLRVLFVLIKYSIKDKIRKNSNIDSQHLWNMIKNCIDKYITEETETHRKWILSYENKELIVDGILHSRAIKEKINTVFTPQKSHTRQNQNVGFNECQRGILVVQAISTSVSEDLMQWLDYENRKLGILNTYVSNEDIQELAKNTKRINY